MLDPAPTLLSPTPRPAPARRWRRVLVGSTLAGLALLLGFVLWQLATTGDASPQAPPRISLTAFKTLYDDPTVRPLILDVRGSDQYAAGHILGAQSFPESELALRVATLPRDRLIVLYCQ